LFPLIRMTGLGLEQREPVTQRPPRVRRRRRALLIAAAALLIIVAGLAAVSWWWSGRLLFDGPYQSPWSLNEYPQLKKVMKPLTVHSSTGVRLVGRLFPGRYRATIVLSHGYGGDQDDMLPAASSLHTAGFTVVTYNERGRGGSGGHGTWGALETNDLHSVIDTVVRLPQVNPNEIGELGQSIGADISIMEAAPDKRIKAVVAISSWPSLQYYWHWGLGDWFSQPNYFISHPKDLLRPFVIGMLELRIGTNLSGVRPVDYIGAISPRPIFLIQGTKDTDVAPQSAIVNYDHARAPRELWMVKGQGHYDIMSPGGAGTSERVVRFFLNALKPAAGT
jgi:pimeloyl-ACP methyl ester carboxylesterase